MFLDKILPEDRVDVTLEIRGRLQRKGICFDKLTWIETQEIVELGIRAYKAEIIRLRGELKKLLDSPPKGAANVEPGERS